MGAGMKERFDNIGVGTRLAVLVFVAFFAVMLTAFTGMTSNRRLVVTVAAAYQGITRPLAAVANARGEFNAMRTGLYDLAHDFNSSMQNALFKEQVMRNLAGYEQNIRLYKEILDAHGTSDPYEQEAVAYLFEQLAPLRHAVEAIAAVAEKTGRGADVVRMLRGAFQQAADDVASDLLALTNILEAQDNNARRYADNLQWRNGLVSSIILLSSALFLLCIAYITVHSITKPMKEMTAVAEQLSKGNLDVHIGYRSKNEIGILADSFRHLTKSVINIIRDMQTMAEKQSGGDVGYFIDTLRYDGSYKNMTAGINAMMQRSVEDVRTIVGYLSALANGDFNARIEPFPGKKAVINAHLESIHINLHAVHSEIDALVRNAANGRLAARVNADRYTGDWRSLMEELNALLNALIMPINEASQVLSQIAEGNFEARVLGHYKGDIARIKDAVNATAAGLAAYLRAKLAAERAAHESELAKGRAEAAHEAVMSGIKYASKIQNSLLPSEQQFASMFADYSILWAPRDIVGGDIYWMKTFGDEAVVCVCDCTGHGTPGSLLTMLVVSALDTVVDEDTFRDTAEIMRRLDHKLADILNVSAAPAARGNSMLAINDGCDLAILHIARNGTVSIASSNTNVFVCDGTSVRRFKGQRLRIGDGGLADKGRANAITVPFSPGITFYIATDGLYDQIGGSASRPFGYAAAKRIMLDCHEEKQSVISEKIWAAFEAYRGEQQRRDDVQLISFEPKGA